MGWGIRKKPVLGAEPARTRLRTLESRRMTMVAANTGLVQADLRDVTLLGMMLDAIVPENWPPDLYDREPMEYALRQLADPAEHGWSFWYLLTSERGGRKYWEFAASKDGQMQQVRSKLVILC